MMQAILLQYKIGLSIVTSYFSSEIVSSLKTLIICVGQRKVNHKMRKSRPYEPLLRSHIPTIISSHAAVCSISTLIARHLPCKNLNTPDRNGSCGRLRNNHDISELSKMPVECKGGGNAGTLHNRLACAICTTPFLIAKLLKNIPRTRNVVFG